MRILLKTIFAHLCIFITNSVLITMPLIFRFYIYPTTILFRKQYTISVILMTLGILFMMLHNLYFIIRTMLRQRYKCINCKKNIKQRRRYVLYLLFSYCLYDMMFECFWYVILYHLRFVLRI